MTQRTLSAGGFAVVSLATLASLAVVAMADQASPDNADSPEAVGFHHVFEGRNVPLELDTSRFAVHADDAATATLDVVSSLPIHGWRLVRPSVAARSGGGVIEDVKAAAQR